MPPAVPFVERWYYTDTFLRHQLQAHPWQQRDDPQVREALFFDESTDHVRDFGELIKVDIPLRPKELIMSSN